MADIVKKNKGGRPSKLPKFLIAMEKVMHGADSKELNTDFIALTDEELFEEINERLDKKDKIHPNSFLGWKAKARNAETQISKEQQEYMNKFLVLYKNALRNQKRALFHKLSSSNKDDRAYWQRFAWIIERKFADWNLKHLSEVKQDTSITYNGMDFQSELSIEEERAKVITVDAE